MGLGSRWTERSGDLPVTPISPQHAGPRGFYNKSLSQRVSNQPDGKEGVYQIENENYTTGLGEGAEKTASKILTKFELTKKNTHSVTGEKRFQDDRLGKQQEVPWKSEAQCTDHL